MEAAEQRRALDRRGVVWGVVGVAVVIALTFVGSDGLVWFDAALVGYLFGSIFAVFGVVYRYAVWVRRPPTAMLNRRGLGRLPPAQGAQPRRPARRSSAPNCWPRGSSAGARGPGGWPTSSCSGAASSPPW